jgi:hypothetical protein
LFTTAAINFDSNLKTHLDRQDCALGAIVVLGSSKFKGGAFLAHQLRLRIELEAGDVMVFPSNDIHHSVEPILSSKGSHYTPPRYSIAYFTQQSTIARYRTDRLKKAEL